MDYTDTPGANSDYYGQNYWPTSTAMARNTSHESAYSSYSESSNGQYDTTTQWQVSDAMTRNMSHQSGNMNYAGPSNEHYDVAQSPTYDTTESYNLLNVQGVGTYITDNQAYDTTTGSGQAAAADFDVQYYDFITSGDPGQGPYWQLKAQYTPSANYPKIFPVVQSSPEVPRAANDASGRHVCLEAHCEASPFKRKADLQRHYLHKHRAPAQKQAYPCDWKRCQRSRDPFYRLDHCREHYRDFHQEDLVRRGGSSSSSSSANNNKSSSSSSSSAESRDWWKNRNVDVRWWRCSKCLARIAIDDLGFECPRCNIACEPERRKLRGF
ncbi:hypothetical protein M426DRAFT_134311 [Hypoxylon sp. CI-4A]|nr:hypothetical protein M426DRAFT_134311 [Hypoxylon sp. CI-4A]